MVNFGPQNLGSGGARVPGAPPLDPLVLRVGQLDNYRPLSEAIERRLWFHRRLSVQHSGGVTGCVCVCVCLCDQGWGCDTPRATHSSATHPWSHIPPGQTTSPGHIPPPDQTHTPCHSTPRSRPLVKPPPQDRGPHPTPLPPVYRLDGNTVNARVVRILLECILVSVENIRPLPRLVKTPEKSHDRETHEQMTHQLSLLQPLSVFLDVKQECIPVGDAYRPLVDRIP